MWSTFRSHISVNVRQKVRWRPQNLRMHHCNALYYTLRRLTHMSENSPPETHTHQVPPAASGRLNHALIKPWSEFQLEHYPLRVINAPALRGGEGSEGNVCVRVEGAYHPYGCWHHSSVTLGRTVYITRMDDRWLERQGNGQIKIHKAASKNKSFNRQIIIKPIMKVVR